MAGQKPEYRRGADLLNTHGHCAASGTIGGTTACGPDRSCGNDGWGAPVANGYAMSEGMFTGSCGHGIHLPDDLCILEPVDADGNPAGPGELSNRILVTNLYNHTQPLIRYEVTDQVTLIGGPCPCGSGFRRIEDPQGRLDDVFEFANGLSVHPHVFRSALGQHPDIIEYQVRQTSRGAAIAIVAAARVDMEALQTKITEALALLGLSDPDVTIDTLVELPRQVSGKLKRFVPPPTLRRTPRAPVPTASRCLHRTSAVRRDEPDRRLRLRRRRPWFPNTRG